MNIRQSRSAFLSTAPAKEVLQKLAKKGNTLNNYNKAYSNRIEYARFVVEADNRQPEDPVLLYFHGGGYVFGLETSHVNFLIQLAKRMDNPRLSIIAVDYSLAPESPYPAQLREAAELYRNLVDIEGCKNIILGGDSAGGNLSITLTAHLKYHNPLAPVPQNYVKPSAIFLISPWLVLSPEIKGSYHTNFKSDMLGVGPLEWSNAYSSDQKTRDSVWNSPGYAAADYWKDVFPDNTLITVGDKEVMVDEVERFYRNATLKRLYVHKNASHNSLFLDRRQESNEIIPEVVDFLKNSL